MITLAFPFQPLIRFPHSTPRPIHLGVTNSKYLPLSDIAERYGLKPRTFQVHADEKGVPFLLFGSSRRYDPLVVETFFAARPPEKEATGQGVVVQLKRPTKKKKPTSKFAQALG